MTRLRGRRKFIFEREDHCFDAMTTWNFLCQLRQCSRRSGRRVVVITDNAKYHHAKLHADWRAEQQPDFVLSYLRTMDAGLTSDLYKPTALRPFVSFRVKVKIGGTVYLPMEMNANYAALGRPAQSTRIDLTLGEDSNGDGLPDAWQYAVIAALGGGLTLADITPNGDADHDGISNMDEYLAGTYAFDPSDGFRLDVVGFAGTNAVVEFLAIRGHSYSLQASADLQTWTPVQFCIPAEGISAISRDYYQAIDVRYLRVEALPLGAKPSERLFFRAQVH
ncbi:MAG: hypothetical protein ACM34E_19115 [Acidobacteriota bacterium]